jgi:hypothetical protein
MASVPRLWRVLFAFVVFRFFLPDPGATRRAPDRPAVVGNLYHSIALRAKGSSAWALILPGHRDGY